MIGAVLRSLHFFGRLRKSEVPEPTPATLGRLRLQAKISGSSYNFSFLALKKLVTIKTSIFGSYWHKNKAFLFSLPKICSWSCLKKTALGSDQQKSRLWSRSKSGGSRRLRNTGLELAVYDWSRLLWLEPPIMIGAGLLWLEPAF